MRALASAPRARRRRSKIARDTAARDSTREFLNCFAKRVYTNFYDYDARAANFTANTLR